MLRCSFMTNSVTPWTVTWQLPLSMGFPRQEWRGRSSFCSPEDRPDRGMEPASPALQADSLWLSYQGSPSSLVHIFCCSVTKSRLTLCDPMTCSTPVFLFLNYLSEFAPIQGHWVKDTIQPSHPLLPTLLLPLIFPSIRVLSSGSALCLRWPEYRSFNFSISSSNEYSRLVSFRIQGTLKSLLQHHILRALSCPMSESPSRRREVLQDNATRKKGSLLLTRVRAPAASNTVVRDQRAPSPTCYTNL